MGIIQILTTAENQNFNEKLRQESPDFNQADECLLLSDCLLNLLKIKLILILGNSHAIINVTNSKEVQAA